MRFEIKEVRRVIPKFNQEKKKKNSLTFTNGI